MSVSNDPIVSMSQMAGDPGLDSPRAMPAEPDEILETFAELFKGKKLGKTASEPEMERVYKAHAKVFLIDSGGNPDYEKILNQGMSGEVILGKREICDIKGSADFKVYMEWMVPSMQKRAAKKKK